MHLADRDMRLRLSFINPEQQLSTCWIIFCSLDVARLCTMGRHAMLERIWNHVTRSKSCCLQQALPIGSCMPIKMMKQMVANFQNIGMKRKRIFLQNECSSQKSCFFIESRHLRNSVPFQSLKPPFEKMTAVDSLLTLTYIVLREFFGWRVPSDTSSIYNSNSLLFIIMIAQSK